MTVCDKDNRKKGSPWLILWESWDMARKMACQDHDAAGHMESSVRRQQYMLVSARLSLSLSPSLFPSLPPSVMIRLF